MATIHSLFLGVLFIAVCSPLGLGDGIVGDSKWQMADGTQTHAGARLLSRDSNNTRSYIVHIATAEIGVREATGHNDGKRVEEYLAYTGLNKGHAWCAAFVSWCYGRAGLPAPRNPWSPALFPIARTYWKAGKFADPQMRNTALQADIFGIYSSTAKRINHVGLVKETQGKYLVTIEGNSNDRVESRRRHLSTIYALADWINK